MRINYDKKLNDLHDEIVVMGKLVTDSINNSMQALLNKDERMANLVMENDKLINDK